MIQRVVTFFRKQITGKFRSKKVAPGKGRVENASEKGNPHQTTTVSSPGGPARPKRRRSKRKGSSHPSHKKKIEVQADKQVWDPSEQHVPPMEGKTRFQDLPIPLEILHAIADLGFEYCTPVQAEALPVSLAGKDIVGQAQTGTGKTAAFLITLLTRFLKEAAQEKERTATPRALVLAPTRELVIQIAKEAETLAAYCNLQIVGVYGGIDYQKQRDQIATHSVDIMVATPGRLLDFQRRKVVDLSRVEILVIDEADHMLDMGFIPDVRRIVMSTPVKEKRQTIFFSATLTPDVRDLAFQWTKKPIHVEIAPEQVAVDSVEQIVYLATGEEKYHLLYNLITSKELKRVMVFANRRDETRRLTERLKRNGISCAMLSGEVSQKNRIRTLEDFRNGKIQVLVATDVAGRGIHIDDVSHVVNFTLPFEAEDYVHRIGRTGRAGAKGISISFACEEGAFYLPEIEKLLGHKLECVYPDEKLLVPAPRGNQEKKHSSGQVRKRPPHHQAGRKRKTYRRSPKAP